MADTSDAGSVHGTVMTATADALAETIEDGIDSLPAENADVERGELL